MSKIASKLTSSVRKAKEGNEDAEVKNTTVTKEAAKKPAPKKAVTKKATPAKATKKTVAKKSVAKKPAPKKAVAEEKPLPAIVASRRCWPD